MLNISQVQGVIFDLDDTLLDNGPVGKPTEWLHARSRLAAVYEVAERHNLPDLKTLTPEENVQAFATAPVHSLAGAVWNILTMKGLATGDTIDPANPLLLEIVTRKNELHDAILRQHGREVPGASAFIRSLAAHGLADKMALATSAVLRDVDIFLEKYKLVDLFPPERIISIERMVRPKPDPDLFDQAFRSLGLPEASRSQVVAFEDDLRGIASAKAAGLYVCAITTRLSRDDPSLLAAKPELIADSYQEFSQLLGL